MAASSIFLALLTIGVLVLLVKAFRQNRALWGEVRQARRSLPRLLWDALVLWSPLALVIVALAFAANRLATTAVSLTYRLTTLDEFCEVRDMPGRVVLPCTGMRGRLDRKAIRAAGTRVDLDHFLSRQFHLARQQLLALSIEELAQATRNRPAFYRSLAPQGVLGLESAPEDDQELVRLRTELRQLARTPTKPARDVLDIVRFVSERDARVQRIRRLTAMVIARREKVNQQAYFGLSRDAQGRLWLRHRISHLLAPVPVRPDAATEAALARLLAKPGTEQDSLAAFQAGVLSMLAKGEAATVKILDKDAGTRLGSAGLYLALGMPRHCTVASPNADLRLRAADFANDGVEAVDPDRVTLSNSGTFPCFLKAVGPEELRLESLGFRESVRLSIDRWHDEAARTSFRRLGRLGLTAAATEADAKAAARELALAVPAGIHLGRADCGWLHPANCAANAAREAVEEGYARAREDMARRYQEAADSVANTAAMTLEQRIGRSLLTLDAQLNDMRTGAHGYAARFFLVGDLLRLFGWLLLTLIVLKSFLYVLALELFHSDEKMTIAFDTPRPVEGSYRSSRRLTIDREFPYPLITRKQLSNTDNNVCLAPWPWSAPLARILRGRYFLFTKGTFLADADVPPESGQAPRGMVASAGGGLSIVEWKMQPGEEVIFRYKDFYGASENVHLSSEISFRLSTLLLGRIVFRIAHCTEGEGRLLLKANVEEISQEHIRAIPPERMIAWNRHARFTIHSGRTPWKTLLNGYTLVRSERTPGPSGLIVVSSDDVGSNLGSIRFVKRIFSAIF